ncbi:uncharacterized protein LOC129791169 [Lutzomyia longipalpis]|uniref:uncharacterized protein LOC129791169 n=1 Tax=Lutzomyia longipalpis TaxID=7200 RepID=UPI0024834EB5|nr:uncharacterized protein LOC129791169 [Lutzomyia longipalpis]
MYVSASPPGRKKRTKRTTWGSRDRAGMSFLIVVAFFAIFGIIILTEVFMIDDRSRTGGSILRHVSLSNRLGESIPDYEDTKLDYNFDEGSLFVREKFSRDRSGGFRLNDPILFDSANIQVPIPVAPDGETRGHNAAAGIHAIPWGQLLDPKIEKTLPTYPHVGNASRTPTDGSWQVVNGTRFKFFVFSAFYDRRDARMIRVVGATKTRGPERVWCRFWYPTANGTHYYSASVMARVKVIRENWNLKYSACFIICPLRAAKLNVPQAVSIVARLRLPPSNVLLLRNTDRDVDVNRTVTNSTELGVCVKPLHFNYDKALYLLEFLELNSILGVSHFTFYNHTIGPRVACILKHYMNGDIHRLHLRNNQSVEKQVTISLLPWNLRMQSQKEIRTEGLFAALNDCLYRSMYRHTHVALIDLDEYIIPRHNYTLTELLHWLSKRINSRNTGAYSFQNAFFYLQFADDGIVYDADAPNADLRANLLTQRKTRRRSKLHPQKQRSKYICRPEVVIEAGNHFVWEFIPGRGTLNVPADSAILQHYRVCEFGGNDCIKTPSITDRTAHKYSAALVDRISSIYTHLKDTCHLPNLPAPPTRPPPTKKHVLTVNNIPQNATKRRKVR